VDREHIDVLRVILEHMDVNVGDAFEQCVARTPPSMEMVRVMLTFGVDADVRRRAKREDLSPGL
jgi:hypothetical protein